MVHRASRPPVGNILSYNTEDSEAQRSQRLGNGWYGVCGTCAAQPKPERITLNEQTSATTRDDAAQETTSDEGAVGFHGVRYQVRDVQRAADFYSTHLGFKIEHEHLPAFAALSLGPLHLLLSGPGASGSRQMPDGQNQEPGGWNRVVLRANDLTSWIEQLKESGVHFRNDVESGPGGRQIQLEDPDGNPIELFEPRR